MVTGGCGKNRQRQHETGCDDNQGWTAHADLRGLSKEQYQSIRRWRRKKVAIRVRGKGSPERPISGGQRRAANRERCQPRGAAGKLRRSSRTFAGSPPSPGFSFRSNGGGIPIPRNQKIDPAVRIPAGGMLSAELWPNLMPLRSRSTKCSESSIRSARHRSWQRTSCAVQHGGVRSSFSSLSASPFLSLSAQDQYPPLYDNAINQNPRMKQMIENLPADQQAIRGRRESRGNLTPMPLRFSRSSSPPFSPC